MRVRLNDLVIHKFKKQISDHAIKRIELIDEATEGLRLRLGLRMHVWSVMCRDTAGQNIRVSLGRYPNMNVREARNDAYVPGDPLGTGSGNGSGCSFTSAPGEPGWDMTLLLRSTWTTLTRCPHLHSRHDIRQPIVMIYEVGRTGQDFPWERSRCPSLRGQVRRFPVSLSARSY